jgi:hypothetical protein
MFRDFFTDEKPTQVDDLIEVVRTEMLDYGPNEPEYADLLKKLKQLHKMKPERRKRVSWDSVIMVGGHLLGIGILAFVERDTILSRTGLSQLGRLQK